MPLIGVILTSSALSFTLVTLVSGSAALGCAAASYTSLICLAAAMAAWCSRDT